MIVQLGKNDVVRVARANAGLPSSQEETTHVDEEFLAACLRRVAGFHCPCSASTLRTVLLECTSVLVSDEAALLATIDRAIEATYVAGDLLELSQVAVADDMTPGTWVFAAPPRSSLVRKVYFISLVWAQRTLRLYRRRCGRVFGKWELIDCLKRSRARTLAPCCSMPVFESSQSMCG